jgi:hypothetical protein
MLALHTGVYKPFTEQNAVFASDPSQCKKANAPPTALDMQCQGRPADLCGCLNIPTMSKTPFYGCALAGHGAAGDKLPIATLPGVADLVVNANEQQCKDSTRPLSAAAPCALFCAVPLVSCVSWHAFLGRVAFPLTCWVYTLGLPHFYSAHTNPVSRTSSPGLVVNPQPISALYSGSR